MTELVRVTHGVWREPADVDDLRGRVAAILSTFPDGTVVSGLTAARLHGLWLPDSADERVEVIVHPEVQAPASRPGSRRSEVRARRQALLPDEVVVRDGFEMTTEARTWLDLCPVLRMPDVVALGDSALRGQATMAELIRLVSRARHRRGVVRARAALPHLDARSRSRPESHLRYAIVSAGLPKPAVNEPISSDTGEWLSEPDLSYDDVRLAIEYNGAEHAAADRMRKDITRELDVEDRGGWRCVTFGPAEVFKRPHEIPGIIRRLRRERTALVRLRDEWREIK